eukprot:TRINITY_DN1049_c0_g1_i1.p3 TRINITY_DN1049_c0_g1~~TRINITY_DN1049_c0_g1_i1.p3  ORF type:complete len:118 (+),score=18.35 TRINITY_DN1049_c0_g1_i1:204-557(+)
MVTDQHLLAKNLGSLLYDTLTSDITFLVQGERIPAHRCIVGCSSEVLKAMLYGEDNKEAKEKQILMGDPKLHSHTFKELLRYIYTGSCEITSENVFGLQSLADMYLFLLFSNIATSF